MQYVKEVVSHELSHVTFIADVQHSWGICRQALPPRVAAQGGPNGVPWGSPHRIVGACDRAVVMIASESALFDLRGAAVVAVTLLGAVIIPRAHPSPTADWETALSGAGGEFISQKVKQKIYL